MSNIIERMSNTLGVSYSDEQLAILDHEGGMCILACAGSGKALKNGTGVLTPSGYVPIENLKVGDKCYNIFGDEQIVTGVFPQGKKEVYIVDFSDETIIECSKDHLWTYQTNVMRNGSGKWRTDTLENIKNNIPLHVKTKGLGTKPNVYIPTAGVVKFSKKELPIKPYLLGSILGSECLVRSIKENTKDDIYKRVKEEIKEIGISMGDYEDERSVKLTSETTRMAYKSAVGYMQAAMELDLEGIEAKDKFIPEIYKLSSVEDRVAIMQGLIDNGGVCRGNTYEVVSVSERLVDDMKFIVETLGMIAVKIKQGPQHPNSDKVYYRLNIKTSDNTPKIHWSESLESDWKQRNIPTNRAILNITSTGEYAEMTCIKVSSPDGLFLTENCVVTHNTTILTHLIVKRLLSGEITDPNKVLCTTYSRAGSQEMEDRLNLIIKRMGVHEKIAVQTFHATYLRILKKLGLNRKVCTGTMRSRLIKMACERAKLRRLDDEEMKLMDSLLSYQINNLLNDKELAKSYVYTFDDIPVEKYSEVRRYYSLLKDENNIIDFDDMQLYMFKLLCKDKNQDLINYCSSLWNYFFIDEFQDISKIQFHILRKFIKDPTKLIVIGDDDQCIYQWRGADPSIILNICGYYDIKKFVLSTNYRCCEEVVNHAMRGILNNSIRSDKVMQAYNKGGKINIINDVSSTDLLAYSDKAMDYIKSKISDGCDYSDIVVMARNNMHLAILNNMLFKEGIYCETLPEMRLTNSLFYRNVSALLKLAADTTDCMAAREVLWMLIPYIGIVKSRKIVEFMGTIGESLEETMLILNDIYNGDIVEISKRLTPKALGEIEKVIFSFRHEMVYNMKLLATEIRKCKGEADEIFRVLTNKYAVNTSNMTNSHDKVRINDAVIKHIKRLNDELGVEGTLDFLLLTEQYENGNTTIPGDKVIMSTIHGAKGREWKYVVVLGADNVAFPSFSGIAKMLSNGINLVDISNNINEERRLNYVAFTRAKEELTVISGSDDPGVFLLETLGLLRKGDEDTENQYVIKLAREGMPMSLIDVCRYLIKKEDRYKLGDNYWGAGQSDKDEAVNE